MTQSFMTVCETNLLQPGKIYFDMDSGRVEMEYDASRWEVRREAALTGSADEEQLGINWAHRPIYRLLFSYRLKKASDHFTYTFRLLDK